MIGFRGYRGFGDDGTGWSDPFSIGTTTTQAQYVAPQGGTTSAPPLVDATNASGATAGSVATSAVGLVGGLVNIFGQSAQQSAYLQQQALLLQQQAVSPGVVIVGAVGGLLVVGLLIHSMKKGKGKRTNGYRRSRR